MATTTIALPGKTSRAATGVTFGRVVHSEWIKLRSLRSTIILLLCTVTVMGGLAMLGAWGMTSAAADGQPVGPGAIETMPSGGLTFGQLVIGALAVLLISSEYATGMIRSTMIAVPSRLPAFFAKAVVMSAVAYLIGVGSAFASYFAIQPILATEKLDFAFDRAILGSILCAGLYLVFVTLMGLGLGALLRNSAGSIVTLTALLMVLPTALSMIPGDFAADVAKYLPSNAGTQLTATRIADEALTQLQGGLVMALWAIVPFIIATVLIKKRDV
ncbi:MAG TPA: ABC transporter permease [Arthrobacter sp.]|nr:ABC transporter permease [Arthrobacter sp.]